MITREYCCSKCGLVFYTDESEANKVKCPECDNYLGKSLDYMIYDCASYSFFYNYVMMIKQLNSKGKIIHYETKRE